MRKTMRALSLRGFTVLLLILFVSVSKPAFAKNWSHDWSIAAEEDGLGYGDSLQKYNQVDIWYESGDSFDTAVFTNYTKGWATTQDGLSSAYLFGSATDATTYFTLNFYGKKESTQLLYMTALDNTVTGRWLAEITPDSFTTRELSNCDWYKMGGGDPIVTPEPLSAVLFGVGGVGLYFTRRRISPKDRIC
jgi:hypothetical protein